ncbi:hypothetical protein ROE7235_03670 [Roseibaca ekhonensis]|uniref:Helix-turn-helix domain-containing protein n=1 Tax=Roseinatronobacter ekhonensis TaxID=254356 RepID=A0A3B0MDE2_9RHOB|nr:hypothetical protein ROE7235_03670 [Roseibaca ekhonensis]
MQDTIPLTDAPRALAAHGLATTYQRLWGAVVAGQVPAERVGKRWHVREADLAVIAKTLKRGV